MGNTGNWQTVRAAGNPRIKYGMLKERARSSAG